MKFWRNHLRLLIALCAGIGVTAILLMTHLRPTTSAIIGWDTLMWTYLTIAAFQMRQCGTGTMKRRAIEIDESEITILVIALASALLSFLAIIFELSAAKSESGWLKDAQIWLTLVTLLSSWAFMNTAYAFHYAHSYYANLHRKSHGGLIFPGQDLPQYSDFIYFAFVIGTSGQTADISFATTQMRRVGVIHSVLSFLFNATLIGMMINIAANLTG
jgi:uncharacterized membrane protein